MNQTRAFLIFGWLMIATLLWMEWGREQAPQPTTTEATTPATDAGQVPAVPSVFHSSRPLLPSSATK